MAVSWSLDNPVVSALAFYSAVVILKMFGVVLLIVVQRTRRATFANQEDADLFHGPSKKKPMFVDEEVERLRRCHLNDLENIPVFILAGLLYVLVDPSPQVALWHFRVFAAARLTHTVAYLGGLQPWRGMMWTVGFWTTVSMLVQVILGCCN